MIGHEAAEGIVKANKVDEIRNHDLCKGESDSPSFTVYNVDVSMLLRL